MTGALSVLLLVTTATKSRSRTGHERTLAGVSSPLSWPLFRLLPYLDNVARLGVRETAEIGIHSAVAKSYLSAPVENWLWGWTSSMFTGDELHLFPGVIATALALAGLAFAPRRTALVYGGILGVGGGVVVRVERVAVPLAAPVSLPATGAARDGARLDSCVLRARAARRVRRTRAARQMATRLRRAGAGPGRPAGAQHRVRFGADAPQPVPATPPVYQLLRQLPRGVVADSDAAAIRGIRATTRSTCSRRCRTGFRL